jgi:hypothetical protein
MPYAICKDCELIMTRSGGRGRSIKDMCCPACGGDLKGTKTPIELGENTWGFNHPLDEKWRTMGQAVARWLYDARKNEPAWVAAMSGKWRPTKAE